MWYKVSTSHNWKNDPSRRDRKMSTKFMHEVDMKRPGSVSNKGVPGDCRSLVSPDHTEKKIMWMASEVGEVCETKPKETLCSAASEVRSGRSSQSCDPAAQCIGKRVTDFLWVNTTSHAETTHAWVSLRICWSVLLFFDLLCSCWNLRYQSDQARSDYKMFLKKREQRSCFSEQQQKKEKCPGWSNLAAATKPGKKPKEQWVTKRVFDVLGAQRVFW